MKPTKVLLAIAKRKASGLGKNQMIRVGGSEYEKSYWVYKDSDGDAYIGYLAEEPLSNFFSKRSEYVVNDKNGKLILTVQILSIN